jgi:hypothetical protein
MRIHLGELRMNLSELRIYGRHYGGSDCYSERAEISLDWRQTFCIGHHLGLVYSCCAHVGDISISNHELCLHLLQVYLDGQSSSSLRRGLN